MLHEFVHILLGDSSVSGDLDPIDKKGLPPAERKIEVFCNQVAASTLLPMTWFKTNKLLASYNGAPQWNDDSVYEVSKKFHVSREFVWRRLLSMSVITTQIYNAKRQTLLDDFRAQKEKEKKKNTPIIPFYRKLLSSTGYFYAELVLTSYHQDAISLAKLSEYLGTKLKHLPKIENAIFQKR
jgi:Zn-dependent peptidase ImmA (M78 family)